MKTLGICGGNGVLLHPFRETLIGNIEPRSIFYSPGNLQWKSNFSVPMKKEWDLSTISECDVILGAPDCGHSSVLSYSRKKSMSNPKDNSSLTFFLRSIKEVQPKLWLMENLAAFLKTYTEQDIQDEFPNYELIFINTSVINFGNSQVNRERLVIVGINRDKFYPKQVAHMADMFEPKPVAEVKKSGQLLKGLKYPDYELCHVREDITEVITMYAGFKISLAKARRYWKIHKNASRWIVKDRKFSTAPGVYRNLRDKLPATARKSNRQFNHNGLMMSPRELARIQGIPDNFKLYMDKAKAKYWINKGRATVAKTPPYEIGLWFRQRIALIENLL